MGERIKFQNDDQAMIFNFRTAAPILSEFSKKQLSLAFVCKYSILIRVNSFFAPVAQLDRATDS